ncbi:uncharacterized protein LAESUDRAFT_728281, partial [Laetiporus sulphureus 93-53]
MQTFSGIHDDAVPDPGPGAILFAPVRAQSMFELASMGIWEGEVTGLQGPFQESSALPTEGPTVFYRAVGPHRNQYPGIEVDDAHAAMFTAPVYVSNREVSIDLCRKRRMCIVDESQEATNTERKKRLRIATCNTQDELSAIHSAYSIANADDSAAAAVWPETAHDMDTGVVVNSNHVEPPSSSRL